MRIALSTPINLRALAPYFGQDAAALPAGLGSTATTPLVAALLDRGHEVTLFTLSREVQQETVVRGRGITAFVGPMRAGGRARNLWKDEIDYLAGAIAGERPAFVHAHWTYEFAMGAVRGRVPVLVTIHDLPWDVFRYYRDPYRAARLLLAYQVAFRCKHYTAVSSYAGRHFRRYFRPDASITIVPNFLSDEIFDQGAGIVTREHPLTFYTVLQGWSILKNANVALKAFARVRRVLPTSRLLMIGADYQPGGLAHSWALDHGLSDGVEFRGPLPYPDMLAIVQAEADILVHPSLSESFSMTALEGMALRKPVIGGHNALGIREVLDWGRAGILVDMRSSHELAEAMERLGVDLTLREAQASAAYASASRRFRSRPVLDAYEALYSDMAARSATSYAGSGTATASVGRAWPWNKDQTKHRGKQR